MKNTEKLITAIVVLGLLTGLLALAFVDCGPVDPNPPDPHLFSHHTDGGPEDAGQ